MALRVSEKLEQTERAIQTTSTKDHLLQSSDIEIPDVEIPAIKLSLKEAVQLLQQWFHHEPTRVRGEIVLAWPNRCTTKLDQSVTLWYHYRDESGEEIAGKEQIQTSDPDQVTTAFVEGLLKRINPPLWALYLAWNKHDEKKALETAESILHSSTKPEALGNAYLLMGSIAERNGKHDEAIEEYRRALSLDSKFSSAYNGWGIVLFDKKEYENAVAKFKEAVKLSPKSIPAWHNWGRALVNGGHPEQAMDKFNRVLKLDSDSPSAYEGLGAALNNMGKPAQAIHNFQRALEIDPKSAFAYYGWGTALSHGEQKYDEAVAKFEKCINMGPSFAPVYEEQAIALSVQGKLNEAIEKLRRAVELDPRCVTCYVSLGQMFTEGHKYNQATDVLQKALKLDPTF